MNQPSEKNLYDKTIDRLKNSHWVVTLLILAAILAGISASTTHIKGLIEIFIPNEDPSPKFSVKYYTIGGHAISLLLTGTLEPSLQKQLGGRPIVWKNSVFDELRILHNKYALQSEDYIEFSGAGLTAEQLESLNKTTKLIPFSTHHSFIAPNPETVFDLEQIGDPLKASGWKIAFIKERPVSEITAEINNGEIFLTRLLFSKRIPCRDAAIVFEKLNTPIASLLKENNGSACQDLDFQITAQYYDDECAGEQHWLVSVDMPGLEMSTAIIENISDKPITVKNLLLDVKKTNGIGLLSHSKIAPQVKGTIGDGTLQTKDRLIIPLSLRFSTEFHDTNYNPPLETYQYSEIGADKIDVLIAKHPTVNLMVMTSPPETDDAKPETSDEENIEPNESVTDTPPSLQPITFASMPSELLRTRYGFTPDENKNPELPYIGTILTPKTVEINGIKQEIHEIQLGGMYVSDSISGASCPYLFTKNADGGVVPLGKILVGHNQMAKDGVDARHLKSWPSTLLLKEIDPEVTHLRSAALICETTQGEIITRHSINDLQHNNQTATILKQGEEISLNFPPLPEKVVCKSVFARIGGYYIPETQSKSIRQLSLHFYQPTDWRRNPTQ